MPKRLLYTILTILVFMGILTAIILTKCTPNSQSIQTPTVPTLVVATALPVHCDPIDVSSGAAQTVLTLPDGSQIYLAENTEIEITPAGYCPGLYEHKILLKHGQVAVISLLPVGNSVVVTSPTGYFAQISGTGLVTLDPVANDFIMDCTSGTCALGAKADKLISLGCGESGYLDAYGNFNGLFNVDLDRIAQFGDWLMPKCVPALTSTPKPANATLTSTPTMDVGATATAYCNSFRSQFALTPCPTLKPSGTPSPTTKP